MTKLILSALLSLSLCSACADSVPVSLSTYSEDAGPACQVVYVYVPVEGDAGMIECPPQEVCASPDAGAPDAGAEDGGPPHCEKGEKKGNKHCED